MQMTAKRNTLLPHPPPWKRLNVCNDDRSSRQQASIMPGLSYQQLGAMLGRSKAAALKVSLPVVHLS